MAESEEYMTVAEARDYLGVSKRKITQFIENGILKTEPNIFDKRSKLIRRADVEALMRTPGGAARKDAA
jgi:excisionase family DNA binding protein